MIICIIVSFLLFSIGLATALIRKNLILVLLGIELCLNACNLLFITFSNIVGSAGGQGFALFIIIVAAAEVAVGLTLVIKLFWQKKSVNVDLLRTLKE